MGVFHSANQYAFSILSVNVSNFNYSRFALPEVGGKEFGRDKAIFTLLRIGLLAYWRKGYYLCLDYNLDKNDVYI